MTDKPKQLIEILLVEDNPGDVRLILEAFQEAKVRNKLAVVGDGEEALRYLHKEGKYASASAPGLILLDINLPKKNGFEVLEVVKNDEELKHIPVVILTSSQSEQDILMSYNLFANAYISKPVGLEQLLAVVKAIESFWLEIVKLV